MNNQYMSPNSIASLKGIVVPTVTPLINTDTLDVNGLHLLVEHVINGGISGIFLLGTTGEFASLSYNLRYEVVERACKQIAGRVRVMVGITDTSFSESIRLANYAADMGADALVAAPPYYYAASQQELAEYYEKLASQVTLPLFLYNMPVHTKVVIEAATVKRIADNRNVAGLKDSSGNLVYFRSVQQAMLDRSGFLMFMGPEEITAEAVLMGASGGVNGGANMFPDLYVQMYHAAVAGDLARVKVLQQCIMLISSKIYSVGRFGSSYLKGLKTALSVLGICDDFVAEPFNRFHQEEREKIARALADIQALLHQSNVTTHHNNIAT
jgi:dihydrodipicolinate synthase/N-acetylneuraminate lyase